LKKLLLILLLIGLSGKISGYYHLKMDAISMMQNAEEKSGKSGEGKNENDCLSYTASGEVKLPVRRPCSAYFCKPCLSPLLSRPTPPPDGYTYFVSVTY
jgi:hypothetical protein